MGPRVGQERGRFAGWNLHPLDDFGLRVSNDGTSTYYRDGNDYEGVIDLTLAGPGVMVTENSVLSGGEGEIGSDRMAIERGTQTGPRGGTETPAYGWDIGRLTQDQDSLRGRRRICRAD